MDFRDDQGKKAEDSDRKKIVLIPDIIACRSLIILLESIAQPDEQCVPDGDSQKGRGEVGDGRELGRSRNQSDIGPDQGNYPADTDSGTAMLLKAFIGMVQALLCLRKPAYDRLKDYMSAEPANSIADAGADEPCQNA